MDFIIIIEFADGNDSIELFTYKYSKNEKKIKNEKKNKIDFDSPNFFFSK